MYFGQFFDHLVHSRDVEVLSMLLRLLDDLFLVSGWTNVILTLKSASHDNIIITAQWEGMGDVGLARYEPALLPPCPTIRVLSNSNCQRSTRSISK